MLVPVSETIFRNQPRSSESPRSRTPMLPAFYRVHRGRKINGRRVFHMFYIRLRYESEVAKSLPLDPLCHFETLRITDDSSTKKRLSISYENATTVPVRKLKIRREWLTPVASACRGCKIRMKRANTPSPNSILFKICRARVRQK